MHSVPMSFRSIRQSGESPSVLVEIEVATDGLTTSVEAHGDWHTQGELGSCLEALRGEHDGFGWPSCEDRHGEVITIQESNTAGVPWVGHCVDTPVSLPK